ncbi:DUF885 domain-containing protein [Knoellia koreensis]|uniref:DUF885 domain-containing protein n=1 Tax=Knoellia koreensis TaxID=2730921 RepID=A0A849HJ70_9MICO|nr:DUF885 domain-containing protein [Knoellia sp. DB2414S]NNM47995.1 DUF885 domain-containing protein [Knoellia sp. DB2414S]
MSDTTSGSDAVRTLADEFHEWEFANSPTWAHMMGDYGYADRFEDATRAAEDATIAAARGFAERARAIPDDGLTDQDKITRDMVAFDADSQADVAEGRLAELSADPIFGIQVDLQITAPMLALPTVEVAEALPAKYRAMGQHLSDLAERHREGVANGRVPARFAVDGVVGQIDEWLATDLDDDPMLTTATAPEGLDADEWRQSLRAAIEESLRPGLARFREVLRDEVAPIARDDDHVGLLHVPGGPAAYTALLAHHTTTSLGAQEIHDIGLAQIAKLDEEYAALGQEVFGVDDPAAVRERLRSDPEGRHTSAEDIVAASEAAFAKAREAMPQWFGRLPKAECIVQATTHGAAAYYYPPADDGSRPGTFFVNTEPPSRWGRHEIEALAYHEGIPGHHLQLAIATELTDLPDYRRHVNFNAYAEGWGLYTERLADEMGLYSGQLERLGMLTMDSMRACRLVVDTGIHALGWSRQQAVDYMAAHCAMAVEGVQAEIDRYITHPGQATSYMIGRLELLRIRAEAKQRQGEAFEVSAFHDAVLDSGSMPLTVLEQVVETRLA